MPAFRALIVAIAVVFTCSLMGIVPDASANNGSGGAFQPTTSSAKKKKKNVPQTTTQSKPKKTVAGKSNAPAKSETRYRKGEVLFVLIDGKSDDDL